MTQPDQTRPQPVLDEAKAAGLLQAVFVAGAGLFFTVKTGITADNFLTVGTALNLLVTAVVAAGAYFVPIFRGKTAAAQVTPLESPQGYDGQPLLTADQWAARWGRHARQPAAPVAQQEPDEAWTRELKLNVDSIEAPIAINTPPSAARKLGRLPNDPTKPRVRLTSLEAPTLTVTPPPSIDWYSKVDPATWGMDGNDRVGDCTCAEVDHCVKALQVAAGNPEVKSQTPEVLATYSAITGYDPRQTDAQGNNPTDQGAVMQDVRGFWRKNGVQLGGKKHTILLFAEVEHRNHDLIKWCIARFGEVGIGFNFPASAMTQFDAGQPWTVVKGSAIDGGHAVSAVGYDTDYVYVVTWGAVQRMAWAFFDAYVDECWTQLSEEWVSQTTGSDPWAETAYALGEQYAEVTGQANPFPAPTPAPAPSPAPAPAPGIPADWVAWARHVLTLKGQSHLTVQVAREIVAAAGQ